MTEPWAVSRVLAWIRALGPKCETLGPYELLEISPTDDLERIREAYHAVAATRHPDLFRGKLPETEAESLMRVFGRVSNAYALLRDPEERAKYGGRQVAKQRATPPVGTHAVTPTPTGQRRIAPRALSHVRRAEAALDTGDVASAVLHLRMAVASDPQAKELRTLLSETEAKLKK